MWKDWLTLSKNELRGFLVMSFLLVLLAVFYYTMPFLNLSENKMEDHEALLRWVDSVCQASYLAVPGSFDKDTLFPFDANKASIYDLEALGIKGAALINWLKFRERKKGFEQAGDVFKVYSLDSSLANRLLPYIFIDKEDNRSTPKKDRGESTMANYHRKNSNIERVFSETASRSENASFLIEINTAGSEDFTRIKGVGDVLSKRIVAYRSALGGFFSIDQMKEIYGIAEDVIEKNRIHLEVTVAGIRKINVNRAGLSQLKSHPYISYYLAKSILEYKKLNGSFKSLGDLYNIEEIDSALMKKLENYLTVEADWPAKKNN